MNQPESLTLDVLGPSFSVCRLGADEPIPDWASPDHASSDFISVSRTAHEVSIVCESSQAPSDVERTDHWRCLRVEGPLDFALVGILSKLFQALAAAEVPVFAFSTFDTDYLLVRERHLATAVGALRDSGQTVRGD